MQIHAKLSVQLLSAGSFAPWTDMQGDVIVRRDAPSAGPAAARCAGIASSSVPGGRICHPQASGANPPHTEPGSAAWPSLSLCSDAQALEAPRE